MPSIESQVDGILNRQPAVGLAVGVVRGGALESFTAHGLADIVSRTPVAEDTVFRVGSLTKTFTAIAVLQLVERGLVDLDAPAGAYLRACRLIPADPGWRPATARHLLTHTAGIGEVLHPSGVVRPLFGETIAAGRPVLSPAEYYGGGLRVGAEPGTRFRYTDHGFAMLGQLVEDVTGQPFHAYLREHVFAPLGMTDTHLVLPASARSRLATGYDLRRGGPRPVTDYEVVTAGAGAACSTLRDMARYLAALLGGGSNEHGAVLEPETLTTMFAPQYRPDPRIPGLGLAFFRGATGKHRTVEHQGVVPASTSQIVLAPDDGLGVMAFTNGTRGGMFWLPVETGRLLGSILGVPAEKLRTDVPQRPEIWGDLCGWYSLSGPLTDVRARGMLGAGIRVAVHRGGLLLRCLSPVPALLRGLRLHPHDAADPYVFRAQLPGVGALLTVVFAAEPGQPATAVHLDLMPLTAHRCEQRSWTRGYEAGRRRN